jgi:tRNA pseudouridine55 synthase
MIDVRAPEPGYLLIDKPIGPTSHDIVDRLRRALGVRTIGHAGTLDPFASGLLIVAVGRPATRGIERFRGLPKAYRAAFILGTDTDTHDRDGKPAVRIAAEERIDRDRLEAVLAEFRGPILQMPPMHAAKKIGGRKLYEFARRGETVERAAVPVMIDELSVLGYSWPRLEIAVRCSTGTYIRALARDIGERLACGAYVDALRRTAIGPYRVEAAVPPEAVTAAAYPSLRFEGAGP